MIRNVKPEDAAEICRIYNFYIKNSTATFEDSVVTEDDMASRIRKTTSKFPWLIFENDDHLEGFAYATEWKPRAAYKLTTETTVYIDHESTEKGIGKKLYAELLKIIKSYGFRNAIGSIALPNEKSICLHEHLGFKKAGIIEKAGIKFGQEVDIELWQKRL